MDEILNDKSELRKDIRFTDFGRVECNDVCVLPGVLNNVSQNGLKATFPVLVNFDISELKNDEFVISIRLSRFPSDSIELLAIPMWVFKDNSKGCTQIGFSILPTKDFTKYSNYITKMDELEKNETEWEKDTLDSIISDILPEETICQVL